MWQFPDLSSLRAYFYPAKFELLQYVMQLRLQQIIIFFVLINLLPGCAQQEADIACAISPGYFDSNDAVGKYWQKGIIKINSSGEISLYKELPPGQYTDAVIAESDDFLLYKSAEYGAGESYWCDRATIDLNSGGVYPAPEQQSGWMDHVVLENDSIGFASGQSLRLYDSQYNPIPLAFEIDFGAKLINDGHSYDEIALTGVCYDPQAMKYYISWAKDMSTNSEYEFDSTNGYVHPFKVNRMGIYVFDKNGAFLDSVMLPDSCISPYNLNYLTLTQTVMHIFRNKMIIEVMDQDYKTFLVSIDLRTLQPEFLSYRYPAAYFSSFSTLGKIPLMSTDGDTFIAESTAPPDGATEEKRLLLRMRDMKIIAEIPSSLDVPFPENPERFEIIDAAVGSSGLYFAGVAQIAGSDVVGLFYWDKRQLATLLCELPVNDVLSIEDSFNILTVDENGDCLILGTQTNSYYNN
jgi:hypothetical protein